MSSSLLGTAIGALVMAGLMLNCRCLHYHKQLQSWSAFQERWSIAQPPSGRSSRTGLSLSWTGHLLHVSLPTTQFMGAIDAGAPRRSIGKVLLSVADIPLPHEFHQSGP